MNSNEFGCKVLAESCIVLKNGYKCYIDNPIENIEEQMRSKKDSIEFEITMIVSKGKKRSIKKSGIEKFYSNKRD